MTRVSVHESEHLPRDQDGSAAVARGAFPARRHTAPTIAVRSPTSPTVHAVKEVPLTQISIDPEDISLRGDDAGPEFETFVEQIRRDPRGIHQPIEVCERAPTSAAFAPQTGPRFRLVTGRRRFRAAERLGFPTIRAINLGGDLADGEIRRIQVEENEHRQSTAAIDLACEAARMTTEGDPVDEIMRTLNKSKASVYRLLRIASAFGELPGATRRQLKPIGINALYACTKGEHGGERPAAEALALAWEVLADLDTDARLEAAEGQEDRAADPGTVGTGRRLRAGDTRRNQKHVLHVVENRQETRCVIRLTLDVARLRGDEDERRRLSDRYGRIIRKWVKTYLARSDPGASSRSWRPDAREWPVPPVRPPATESRPVAGPTHPLAPPAAVPLPPASQVHRNPDGKLLNLGRDPAITAAEIEDGFK